MNSIILCEGSTDFVLLQYLMRKAYGWSDAENQSMILRGKVKRSRTLEKGDGRLTIAGCGSVSRLLPVLDYVLERNRLSAGNEANDKIVLITDRDEIETEAFFENKINGILEEHDFHGEEGICHGKWDGYTYRNGQGKEKQVELLLLVIPFEEKGAMETFLLGAISQNDCYDADIIEKTNLFVEGIDSEKRYLTKRRYLTKAKFDVYFSVRTAAEQFVERQNIIKNIEWEKYILIQESFQKLEEI